MRALLGLTAAALLVLSPASAAHASCAEAPTPSSRHFEGVVIEVADQGYAARVVLDDGQKVTVLGLRDRGRSGGARRSNDRRYAGSARYDFHPRNTTSPYRDDACTATVHLTGPHPDVYDSRSDRVPAWLPVDEQAGFASPTVLAGGALLALVSIVAALTRRRRHHAAARFR